MEFKRFSEDIFEISHGGRDWLYLYKRNLLRPAERGLTPNELNLEPFPRRPITNKEWSLQTTPHLIIGVTSTCNLHCSYCHVSGGDFTDTLTEEMVGSIKKLLARALAEKPDTLKISFHSDGESLTKQKVMESIMNFCDAIKGKTRVYYNISSNGTLINDTNIDFIKRLSYVQVSMDGIPELNDINRGSSALVTKGIQTLIKAKVPVTIRATLTQATLDSLKEFVDFMAELVNPHSDDPLQIGVGMVYEGERELTEEMVTSGEDFLEKYLNAKAYAKTKNVELSTAMEIVSLPGNGFCSAVGGTFFTPSGLVSSCTRASRSDSELADRFVYGKFNSETLNYDIDADKFNKLQELRNVPEDCEQCPALMLCGGSTCYVEKGPAHCYARSRLLLMNFIDKESEAYK